MDTHIIIKQYAEWASIAKTWLLSLSKLEAFIILTTLWTVYRIGVYTYRLFLHPLSKYPGPRLAAASSVYEMYHDIVKKGDMTFHMDELHRKYGPIVRISPNKVRLRDSSAFHELHKVGSPLIKDPGFYSLFGLANSTFSTINPIIHRKQRRILDPMFSRRSILGFENVVQEKCDLLCYKIRELEQADSKVSFHNAFVALTIDIVTEYAYAKSYNTLLNEGFVSKVSSAFDAQQEAFMVLKSFPIIAKVFQSLPPWLLMKVFPDGAGFRELEVDAEAQLKTVLEKTRNGEVKTGHRTVFLEMLEGYHNPNPQDLVHEAVSVVGAGMHTTRWILCVGALEVARNPEIAWKLYEELKTAIPNINDNLPYEQLENLPYLRGVVKEALRLGYGIVSASPRLVPREGAVIGGYHLPSDSVIEIDHYSVSHDEEIFPDSYTFSPERWLSPESKTKEKYVIAFGAGSRQCLGVNLAYCELYLAFAGIFRRFELDAVGHDHMTFSDHWMPILRGESFACKVRSRQD
ncbi:cytochrome P450 [Morchella conica CCBAS932]|uniref:Cytochrome P450 n=1 Tax=Morchella conica CCBAS932 TaxID=1392247 RepID=A0A3N4KUB4_9PEZI|nr:cytochrome P450 [Morchella conica CCBAS932]